MPLRAKRENLTVMGGSTRTYSPDWVERPALITGGCGFIGSHLADALADHGREVIVVDRHTSGFEHTKTVRIVREDITNDRALQDLRRLRPSVVFHFAAQTSVRKSSQSILNDLDANVRGTVNVLKAFHQHSLIVYASSAAVYGEPRKLPVSESATTLPISPYGVSKLAGEMYCRMFSGTFGARCIALRFFNVYGPRQRKNIHYDLATKLLDRAESINVLGPGSQVRDFIYVDDAVEATIQLAASAAKQGESFEVFNVGSGRPTVISSVVGLLRRMTDSKAKVIFGQSSWPGDVKRIYANTQAIRKRGVQAAISLREGNERLLEWLRSEQTN